MKRTVIIAVLILIGSSVGAFAQSDEELLRRKVEAALQAQAGLPIPGLFYQPQKSKSGATEALQTGLQGTWWREASWIKELNLTAEQRKKMDDAFLQNRIRLIDQTALLEKEELILEPLVETIRPGDEVKILAQIDKVADARAGLEKANSRMLLAIRQILTQEQWDKLQSRKKGPTGLPFNWPGPEFPK